MSYISWCVLVGMSLTCLPIFAWQWGRKHNNTEQNAAFWVKPHSWLFYDSICMVCFLSPKCVFFYQWCLSGLSSQHYVSMIFDKTVLVKKCTPCQGVVWFSPSKFHIFYTGFWVVLTLHNWSPLKPQTKLQKKSRALSSSSSRGLRALDPANPSSEKNDLPANLFLLCVLPQKCNKFTLAFLTCLA